MLLDKNLSPRIYRYCVYFLHKWGINCPNPVKESHLEYTQIINDALKSNPVILDNNGNAVDHDLFINMMLSEAKQRVSIPDNEYIWAEESERACMWLWIHVRAITDFTTDRNKINLYNYFHLNPIMTSHQERLISIKNLFDRMQDDCTLKVDRLKKYKSLWIQIYNTANYLKNLDVKDEVLIDWLWLYFKDKLTIDRTLPENVDHPLMPIEYLSPLSLREKYLYIYGVLDGWCYSPEAKELFLIKLNKTLSQKKYRQKMTGKVVITTTLYNDTRDKLNELARGSDKRISEILEILINNEYVKAKNK